MAPSSSPPPLGVKGISPIKISSNEINALIYCYLLESNMTHSAFTFGQEAKLDSSPFSSQKISRGELIKWLHRGLLWADVETHTTAEGPLPPCQSPLTLLSPHSCTPVPPTEDAEAPFPSIVPASEKKNEIFPVPSAAEEKEKEKEALKRKVEASTAGSGDKEETSSKRVKLDEDKTPTTAPKKKEKDANGTAKTSAKGKEVEDDSTESRRASNGLASGAGPSLKGKEKAKLLKEKEKEKEKPTSKKQSMSTSASSSKANRAASPSSTTSGSSKTKQKSKSTSPVVSTKPLPSTKPSSNVGKEGKRISNGLGGDAKIKKETESSESSKKDDTTAVAHLSPDCEKVKESDLSFLTPHMGEVFVCKFNPTLPSLLATGSGDATVRLLTFDSPKSEPIVLPHKPVISDRKDITSIDFNKDGTLLGSGSYDGIGRLWTMSGELHAVLTRHSGAIFSLKFNASGTLLATGGADGAVCIWETHSGRLRHAYEIHQECCLDVDWRDEDIVASCSVDKTIQVCRIGSHTPIRTFKGHEDEVNRILWSPTGPPSILASCSDDKSLRIWSTEATPKKEGNDEYSSLMGNSGETDKYCRAVLRGHSKEIYGIVFAPLKSKDDVLTVASASFDNTVRLWDVAAGTCLRVLRGHSQSVFTVSFSPMGRYLASGSWDKQMIIWDLKEQGKPVRKYEAQGGIFEIEWQKSEEGTIAVCQSNKTCAIVSVKDLAKLDQLPSAAAVPAITSTSTPTTATVTASGGVSVAA